MSIGYIISHELPKVAHLIIKRQLGELSPNCAITKFGNFSYRSFNRTATPKRNNFI